MRPEQHLSKLAAAKGLKVVDLGSGHFQIAGGRALVNFWPRSKRRTAYVDGERGGKSGVTPEQAVEMALKGQPGRPPKQVVRRVDVADAPSKRTPAEWVALLPDMKHAWTRKELEGIR